MEKWIYIRMRLWTRENVEEEAIELMTNQTKQQEKESGSEG